MTTNNDIIVIVKFRYNKIKGKDKQYYINKAFDEIYNSDDTIHNFEVIDGQKCQECGEEIWMHRFCHMCGTEQDDYPYDEE